MEKKLRYEDLEADLSGFEQRLAQQLEHNMPDSFFVQDLKQRLVSSQVFKRRREIGATVVACLALLFTATLVFSLSQLIHKTRKSISR